MKDETRTSKKNKNDLKGVNSIELMDKESLMNDDLAISTKNDGGGSSAPRSLNKNDNGESSMRRMQDYKSAEPLWDPDSPVEWTVCELILAAVSWFIVIVIPIFWFGIIKTVRDYERALIFRLGKLKGGAEGPGVFFINPLIDTIYIVDLRIETYNLQPQAMMTKDAVTVTVDAICFMKVIDPIRCILEVDNYRNAFSNFAATTLRSVIGTYDLGSLLSEREQINERIRVIIENETSAWGVAVPSVEIKDVKLPDNMQRAMAAEAEADINKRAKVISAQGEAEAADQLARAADAIADSPGALQLRYLHTLVQIASEKNSTILFPLPMEIMRGIQSFTSAQEQMAKEKRQAKHSDLLGHESKMDE